MLYYVNIIISLNGKCVTSVVSIAVANVSTIDTTGGLN